MAQLQHLTSLGVPPLQALGIVGGNYSAGGFTAAGTNQATATLLNTASKWYVSTTPSGTGVAFPGSPQQGDDVELYNAGANTLLVYTNPSSTDVFAGLGAGVGFSVPSNKGVRFSKVTTGIWMANLSA